MDPAPAVAISLATTVHSDGAGGVADSLTTTDELATWLRLADLHAAFPVQADEALLRLVRRSRRALRTLLSDLTGAPRTPVDDDGSPFDVSDAVVVVNADARGITVAPALLSHGGGSYTATTQPSEARPDVHLLAFLAASTIAVVTGPDRERLRACPAPRCVRYFLQDHPRQTWCKSSCGNRARVARHYQRHRPERKGT